jgi:nucleoid-associated protein YgaU
VTRQKPKISFTATPEDTVQTGPVPVQARRVQVVRSTQDRSTQAGGETAADYAETAQAGNLHEWSIDAPSSKPLKVPNAPAQAVPRAPGLAATGLMADGKPGLIERNARKLSLGGMVASTFVLGVASAVMWLGQDVAPSQQAAISPGYTQQAPREEPTRTEISDMTDVSGAGVSADDLNAAVLAGLQRATTRVDGVQTPPQILDPDTLEVLRANIVAGRFDIGIYTNDGVERVRLTAGDAPLGSIADPQVLQDAGAVGRLEVPLWMRTPEGGMDVEMMIFSLVQTSLLEDPDPAHRDAAIGMSRKIFAASNARTQTVDGNRVYTVRNGDSLAYIALQFYGRPDAFDSILDANRDTLQSPDEIQIGQRLIIPS